MRQTRQLAAAEVATTLRRRWSCQNNRVGGLQIEAGSREVLIGDSWNLYCQRRCPKWKDRERNAWCLPALCPPFFCHWLSLAESGGKSASCCSPWRAASLWWRAGREKGDERIKGEQACGTTSLWKDVWGRKGNYLKYHMCIHLSLWSVFSAVVHDCFGAVTYIYKMMVICRHVPLNVTNMPRVISPRQCTSLFLCNSRRTLGFTGVKVSLLWETEKSKLVQINYLWQGHIS